MRGYTLLESGDCFFKASTSISRKNILIFLDIFCDLRDTLLQKGSNAIGHGLGSTPSSHCLTKNPHKKLLQTFGSAH